MGCDIKWMKLLFSSLVAILMMPLVSAAAAAPAVHIKWAVNLGAPVYNTPRVHDGVVFVDSAQPNGPNVFAVRDGKILWRFATGGAIQMPLTVGRSQVFVASDIGTTHFMRALSTRTGMVIWDYTRSQPPQCMCSHVKHYMGKLLFAQTDGHSLYVFNPESNIPARRLWKFQGDGARLTAPVLAGDRVIFGSADHCVYGLNRQTGTLRWKQATGYAFVARPAISGDIAILGNRGGTVHAYNSTTGKPLWSFATNGPIDTASVIYHGMAFIASGAGDRGIYALNCTTGKQIWYLPMADYTDYSPVIVQNVLIVASRDGTASGIDPESGKILWSKNLHGVPFSEPVINGDAVVIKVDDHRLLNIAAETGEIVWAFHTSAVITGPVVNNGAPSPMRNKPGMVRMPGVRMPNSPRTAEGGTVYIGTDTGQLLALD